MEPITDSIVFETKVGRVKIGKTPQNEWGFDFLDGYANGLYSPEPFKTFDKCYAEVKKQVKNQLQNQKCES